VGKEDPATPVAPSGFLHKIIEIGQTWVSSIRTKIVLPYAVLTLAVAAVGTFVVTQLVAGSLKECFNNQLLEAGRVTSDSVVRKEREHLERCEPWPSLRAWMWL